MKETRALLQQSLRKQHPRSNVQVGVNVDYLAIKRERDKAALKGAELGDRAVLAGSIFGALVIAATALINAAPEQSPVQHTAQIPHVAEVGRIAQAEDIRIPRASEYRDASPLHKREVVNWINQHWKTGQDHAHMVVDLAFKAGAINNIDPLLILAVMARESSFRAKARSSVGAEGLMQVWRKWHEEKFEGIGRHVTPEQNVMIGTRILREYLDRENGDEARALQRYNGALDDPEQEYAGKVFAVYRSLDRVFNASLIHSAENAPSTNRPRV